MTNDKGAKAPKSTAERQAAYRARKAASQLQEVRGIFATKEAAIKIKDYARGL